MIRTPLVKKPGKGKCKICKDPFKKIRMIQPVCQKHDCMVKYSMQQVAKQRANKKKSDDRKSRQEKKEAKEKLKTPSDFKNDLQHEINHIARIIDYGYNCISCGGNGKAQGGHYHTVKAHPAIRFNLFNVWIQDYYCNVKLSSNISGYNIGLKETFGPELKEYIENGIILQYPELHITKFELIEKIALARKIIRELPKEKKYSLVERVEMRQKLNERMGMYNIEPEFKNSQLPLINNYL